MSDLASNSPSSSPPPRWLRPLVTVAFLGLAIYFGVDHRPFAFPIVMAVLALCTLARIDRLAVVRLRGLLEIMFDLTPDPIPGEFEQPRETGSDDADDEQSA
jgi:hypothetical protein